MLSEHSCNRSGPHRQPSQFGAHPAYGGQNEIAASTCIKDRASEPVSSASSRALSSLRRSSRARVVRPFCGQPRPEAYRHSGACRCDGVRRHLRSVARFCEHPRCVGFHPARRSRAAGRCREFHHHGRVTWGLALVGTKSAGRVIAWIGMAMFAALALGAPIGNALRHRRPAGCGAPPGRCQRWWLRASLLSVLRAVWMPGFGSRWGNRSRTIRSTAASKLMMPKSAQQAREGVALRLHCEGRLRASAPRC